jgi:hypothetical protein
LKNKFFKVLKFLYYIFIILAIIKIILSNIKDFKNIDFKIDYKIFFYAILIYLFHKFFSSIIWHYITKSTDCSLELKKSIQFWIYSQKGKFAPGKLFYLFDRVNFYKKNNICKKKLLFLFYLKIYIII